jgi:uncharacterized protein involved in response to NO
VNAIEPYRVLFPLGLAFALAGALVWPLHAGGWLAWPGTLHRTLMIQGFEQSFVLGFLLTALPAFVHAEKARPWEWGVAFATMLVFAGATLGGQAALAQAAWLASVVLVVIALVRRLPRARVSPPDEFVHIGGAMALGLTGGALQLLAALGVLGAQWATLGVRAISLGMVLALVLGVGSVLVPSLIGVRDPLVIPGIALPGHRARRRAFHAAMLGLIVAALAAEVAGWPAIGALLRAAAAATIVLLVWRLGRLPARRDRFGWALWCAGWCLCLGLVIPVVGGRFALAGLHVAFIGGYGLLTLVIASRVVTAHGGAPAGDEVRLVAGAALGTLAAALIARLAAEAWPGWTGAMLGASGAAWVIAWLLWTLRAAPRIAAPAPRPGGGNA